MMDQEKIGKFIAACRKEKGLTQAALAEQLGITDRAVSKWETGKSLPDSSIMIDLCELLSINVNDLLKGERVMTDNLNKVSEELILSLKEQAVQESYALLLMIIVVKVAAAELSMLIYLKNQGYICFLHILRMFRKILQLTKRKLSEPLLRKLKRSELYG